MLANKPSPIVAKLQITAVGDVGPHGIGPLTNKLHTLVTASGPHEIDPNGVASTAATGAPAVNGTIAPVGVASVAAAGVVALRGTISLVGGASAGATGAPKVNAQLNLVGVTSVAATGTIALRGTIALAGVASVAATGVIALRGTIKADGVASVAATGVPTLHVSHFIHPNGVPSTAAAGQPTIGTIVQPPSFQIESGAGSWPDFPRQRMPRRVEPHVITLFGDSASNDAGSITVRPQRMRVVRERELLMLEEA